MANKDLITYIKDNIQPLQDESFGLQYRVSVTLKDGTFLPCVVFRNPTMFLERLIQNLNDAQLQHSKLADSGYKEIVQTFVTQCNRVNEYDILKVEKSRFALPLEMQNQIKSETSMSWTAFVAKFKDGRHLSFGTTWNCEFFDLPEGFDLDDVVEIINHSYLLNTGEIIGHHSLERVTRKDEMEKIYQDRQFFECYTYDL